MTDVRKRVRTVELHDIHNGIDNGLDLLRCFNFVV